jgi:hypothetical protein
VIRQSVFGGLAVANQLGSPHLAESVRVAFVHGMQASLLASGGIAVAGLVLALAFLPARPASKATANPLDPVEEERARAITP